MRIGKQPSLAQIFQLLIAASCLVGWFIPAFYDWTGSDQSRPSPLIGQVASGLVVSAFIMWMALPWLPIRAESRDTDPSFRARFKLSSLLATTAAFAATLAALTKFPLVVSGVLSAIAFCYAASIFVFNRRFRWQMAALLACMILPFAWIVANDDLDSMMPALLWMSIGLPTLLPTMLIGRLIGQHMQELVWLSILLTAAEIVTGIWMIRLGPKRTIAYLVFVLLMSTFGSFGLNALMRA